jgi:hypothetical protein
MLSGKAREGLYYADKLELNARERERCAFSGPARLTISTLARNEGVGSARIHDRIRQAQLELFGRELSSSAISYRLRRRKRLGETRTCAEAGCATLLPLEAPAHRRYCDPHRTPAARVARHRKSAMGTLIVPRSS